MKPHLTIDSPRPTGPGDYPYGTLVCWAGTSTIDGRQGYMAPAWHEDRADGVLRQANMALPCLTRCSYSDAAAHGNPECDPTKPYGHLPRGVFEVGMPVWTAYNHDDAVDAMGYANNYHEKFGPVFIPLLPVTDKDFVASLNAGFLGVMGGQWFSEVDISFMVDPLRSGLGIHGGPLLDDHLRATYGCVRLFDDDAIAVAKWREKQEGTVYLISRGMI